MAEWLRQKLSDSKGFFRLLLNNIFIGFSIVTLKSPKDSKICSD